MSRISAASVMDVSNLRGYYNRLDVYASFTDSLEYDFFGAVDGNIRPAGVFAYMINDVVGRFSKESTLYSRVFRYREGSSGKLEAHKYRIDDYELDFQKLKKIYPEDEDFLEEAYALVPAQLSASTPFNHIWQLTFRLAVHRARGIKAARIEWANIMMFLGYDAAIDKSGNHDISKKRRPCIIVFGARKNNKIEDLEVTSTQRYKKENNRRIADQIERFNASTKVSNARNRIKM